jgi:NitT/TauT family transport system permease protein
LRLWNEAYQRANLLTFDFIYLDVYFPLELTLDILASWFRLFAALFLSIIFSLVVGIVAATNKRAESAILPALDVLQTVPILAFFPVVIYLIVSVLPNFIGINLAVIFLIFTSMSWNITFGVYEAVKAIPSELREIVEISHFSKLDVITELFIPSAMPRIAYQSITSWSIGLFFLVTSEIFSTGSSSFSVKYGIGAQIAKLVLDGTPLAYATAVIFLIAAIVLTSVLFLRPLSIYAERFSFAQEQRQSKKSRALAFYGMLFGAIGRLVPRIRLGGKRSLPATLFETRLEKKERKGIATEVFLMIVLALFFAITFAYGLYYQVNEIAVALAASFLRVWFMYAVCAAISIPLGIKIAKSRFYAPSMSMLQIVSAMPATILLPAIAAAAVALPFGDEMTALAIIFLSMIWYLLFSVVSGMRTVPEQFKDLASIFRMKWTDAWKNIYLPAILPSFVTGSITAVGGAWNALIIAEYFGVERSGGGVTVLMEVGTGIGKLLDLSTFSGNLPMMGLALAAMIVMVVVINKLVWQRLYKKVTVRYRIEV